MRTLFKQNPKEKKKYKPRALTRQVGAMDLDRKGELVQFNKWLEFAAKEKSKFPDKEELDEISKDAKSSRSKSLGIIGLLAAIPLITPLLGNIGNLGLDKINLGGIGDGIKDFTSGLNLPGLSGSSEPGAPGRMPGLAQFGLKRGLELGVGTGAGIAKALTSAPKPPATKPKFPPGRRPVTTSGGGRPGRPNFRNPLRQRPGVTTSGGGRLGRPDIRNPLRQRPRVTQGAGGQKALDRLVKRLFKSKLGLKLLAKPLGGIFRKIPLIGPLIGFLIDITLGGETAKRAGFKAAGSALGGVIFAGILGTLGSLVPIVGSAVGYGLGLWGGQEFGSWFGGWLHDKIFTGNEASTKTTAPSDMSADEILGGTPPTNDPNYQRVSYETADNRAQVTSGQVVQWLHGNPGREGYRADHGGDNAHDHFSFKTRAAAVEAFRALKKAGYKPNEFEGFTSVGRHSPTGGHFGPVGQPPTYDDTSDGVAFDIPWATYGSGPITQKDYDLSFRAAQIVGAVQAGATVDSKGVLAQRPEQEPAYGSGRDAIASGVRQGTEVAMLSPEAEAMNSGVTIIREQAPIQQQPQPGGGMVPVPVSTGVQEGSIIITGPTLDSMYDTQILLRTA